MDEYVQYTLYELQLRFFRGGPVIPDYILIYTDGYGYLDPVKYERLLKVAFGVPVLIQTFIMEIPGTISNKKNCDEHEIYFIPRMVARYGSVERIVEMFRYYTLHDECLRLFNWLLICGRDDVIRVVCEMKEELEKHGNCERYQFSFPDAIAYHESGPAKEMLRGRGFPKYVVREIWAVSIIVNGRETRYTCRINKHNVAVYCADFWSDAMSIPYENLQDYLQKNTPSGFFFPKISEIKSIWMNKIEQKY